MYAVLAQGAAYIHEDTVVSIDPSAMIRDIAHTAGRRGIYHVAFRSGGREVDVPVSYGSLPVRLPDHPGTELRLVASGDGAIPYISARSGLARPISEWG